MRDAPMLRSGFTLIEMVVIITIIGILFGLGLPGLVSAQRRLDSNNTLNVLTAVHNACVRNAKQIGATGVIYGYTLTYSSAVSPLDRKCLTLVPWALPLGGGSYQYDMDTGIANTSWRMAEALSRAKSDIGGGVPWDAPPGTYDPAYQPSISFVDQLALGNSVTLGSSAPSASTGMSLFVAYEPGTGFMHADVVSSPGTPGFALGVGQMSSANRRSVRLQVWNVKRLRKSFEVIISAAGVLDVKGA